MKIQLSPTKIVKDALVIWNDPGPEVDIVMDLKKLTFKENSIEEIYSFHVLDHLFPEECVPAVSNWIKILAPKGHLFTVVDDFEYIARAFVGGDIPIDLINDLHSHPTQFTRDSMIVLLSKAGIRDDQSNIWFADVPDRFSKKHYELVFDSTKP